MTRNRCKQYTSRMPSRATTNAPLRPLALAAIYILLAGCGAGDVKTASTGGAGKSIDLANFNPCDMLTSQEVESIFGETAASNPEPSSAGSVRSCSFSSEQGGKFFTIQLYPETAAEYEADREDNAVDSTAVPELGDAAFFFSGMLRVHVGEISLQVSTWHSRSKQDEALAMTEEIAKLVIARLP